MWPWSADDNLNIIVTHGLECCCMIWSATREEVYCLVIQVLVLQVCCKPGWLLQCRLDICKGM